MAGNEILPRAVQAERAGQTVLSGRIPPPAESCLLRQETGLTLGGLPPGQPIVLVSAAAAPAGGGPDLGGTGKTELAAALARACLDDRAAHLVVWITAASEDAVIAGYAQALRDAGLTAPGGGPEQAAAAFLEWLAGTSRPWLVVLDDLADPAAIDNWWPRGAAGRVLVTTRHAHLGERHPAYVVPVGAFSPREALWYLAERLRADHDQRTGATDLAIELGFLPIALAQAAAVMTATGWNCRQYLDLATRRRVQLAAAQEGAAKVGAAEPSAGQGDAGEQGAARAGAPTPAAVTCSVSAQLADQLTPGGLAGRALSLISMLGPYGIPSVLLISRAARRYLGGPGGYLVDEDQAWVAVQNLARAGLVTIDDGSAARTVLAHALVLAMTRASTTAAGPEQAARAAADALAEVWSSLAAPPDVGQALRDCAVHLQQAGRAALWRPQCHPVLVAAGQSLVSSGMAGQAVAYWRAMLSISEQRFGAMHAHTAQFRDLFAAACEQAGCPGVAVAMYTDLLAQVEQAADSCQPEVLAVRASLARAQAAAGRPADGVRLARQTLDRCEQMQGPGHPDTLNAQQRLADSYLAAGQFKQAVELCQQTLAERERIQGPAHLDTIAARGNLATAYRSGGKLKDAIKQYERALADCHEVLGPGHALTVATQQDLDAVARYGRARLGIDLRKPKHGKG